MFIIACIIYFTITLPPSSSLFFFFNDTATTEIYTLSLHDALPISEVRPALLRAGREGLSHGRDRLHRRPIATDRKSTRLNSSHVRISYAVFCLKKKKIRDAELITVYNDIRTALLQVLDVKFNLSLA